MSFWRIEPRDPVRFGDGRSLSAAAFAAPSMRVPWPSTLAGFVRFKAGTSQQGRFELTAAEANEIAVKGPVLLSSTGDDSLWEACFAAPADAVWFRRDVKSVERFQLGPRPIEPDECTDVGNLEVVSLLAPPAENPGKAESGPAYWRWTEIEKWLAAPSKQQPFTDEEFDSFGVPALPHDRRMHLKIEEGTRTADEGMLFASDAVQYEAKDKGGRLHRFALGLEVAEGARAPHLKAGIGTLGGERRPSRLVASTDGPYPTLSEGLLAQLKACRRFRLVLATPSVFAGGSLPSVSQLGGATLVAAAVGRPQPVSGWDFEKNQPKAVRWMAPAGSVYWVDLSQEINVSSWVNSVWLKSIADAPQDQRDGFGITLLGVG
jgi:CRISPR-associated protein Cmr3